MKFQIMCKVIERILLTRAVDHKLEGYTEETAEEIAEAIDGIEPNDSIGWEGGFAANH
jgi:hypothetical protein